MIFRAQQFDTLKADRKTVNGVGIEWTEPRLLIEGVLWFLAMVSGFVAMVTASGVLTASFTPRSEYLMPFVSVFIVSGGLFYLFARTAARLPGKAQSIQFHESGQIWSSRDGEWAVRAEDIRSIESVQVIQKQKPDDSNYTHGVRIITRRGKVFRIAHNLEPDDSITLAVLLNECIEAVRYPQMRATINGEEVAVW